MLKLPMHVLIREFKMYFPGHARDAVEYFESTDPLVIIVKLNDGRVIDYDYQSKAIGIVKFEEPEDEKTMRHRFSWNLDRAMDIYGYTQQTLSEKSGISQGTISNYLNEKSDPSYINLIKLENALGCPRGKLTEFYSRVMEDGQRFKE